MPRKNKNALRVVNTRLFAEDVVTVQRMAAAEGIAWQIKLRLVLRNALRPLAIPLIDDKKGPTE